jgi:pyruvate,water dikinase
LRLRVRWVQELTARAAVAFGRVLVDRGVLESPAEVVNLRLDELAPLLDSRGSVALDLRRGFSAGPPLPAAFRLTDDGIVVPVRAGGDDEAGKGAGGGRGAGPVQVGSETIPAPGAVLVVRTLDPSLAAVLPGLAGLVAETGSVLSHLAILAREYGVPTVVGLADATERFSTGAWVVVDGITGEVSGVSDGEWGAA